MTPSGQRTAFITGLAGQDGVYLGRYLTGLGYRVVGTVTSKAHARESLSVYLPDADIYEIDVRNHAAIGVLLDRERPDGSTTWRRGVRWDGRGRHRNR